MKLRRKRGKGPALHHLRTGRGIEVLNVLELHEGWRLRNVYIKAITSKHFTHKTDNVFMLAAIFHVIHQLIA